MSIQSIKFNFVRAGGILALSAIFVLGSAGCDLFGSGDSSGDGGSDTAEVSDAVKAELVSTVISEGMTTVLSTLTSPAELQGVRTPRGPTPMTAVEGCSGVTSWDLDNTDGDDYAFGITGASCTSTANLDATSCSDASQTYHLAAGWMLTDGGLNMEFGSLEDSEATMSSMAFGFTLSGTFTGGALTDAVDMSCTVDVNLTAAEVAALSTSFDAIDCESDVLDCTIGGTSYDCGQIKSLVNASLPAACWDGSRI